MKAISSFFTVIAILFSPYYSLAQENEVSFNSDYINRNDGKVKIEVNEVQELTYIMFAMTELGLKDSNMVNHNTSYYNEVIEHFSPYANHNAIKKMNSLLEESIIYHIILSSNAYGFKFNGSSLERTGAYNFPAKGVGNFEVKSDPIITYKKDIEDFAYKSGFRKFYQTHKADYNKIVDDFKVFGAINKQKKWLEERFDLKINSYLVLTSPLIGGINSTSTFEDQSFKETMLVLPTINYNSEWTSELNEIMNSRVIFTEIDHNYVGPLSAKFKNKLDSIFNKRSIWVNKDVRSTEHYPTPIKVFDEYLTWGLFVLYCSDNFPGNKVLLQKVIDHVNDKMKAKGFPKSKEFNEKLIDLYSANSSKKIENLYNDLLDWSADQ